jgi:hypothetical protein
MFQEVSQCMPTVVVLYFGLFGPFEYSPLPLYLPPSVFQQFSVHILISSTFTPYVMRYYWCSIILFAFPSFSEFHRVFHCYKHVLHLSLYMFMLVFLYMFIFRSIFHIWEKTLWLLCFWSWLTSYFYTSLKDRFKIFIMSEDLIHSQRPYLLILSHWGFSFNIGIFAGTNIQTKAHIY